MAYIVPELTVISLDTEDIITASIAISEGDNETSVPKGWWD